MAVVALNLAIGSAGRSGGLVAGGGAPLALPTPPEPDPVAMQGIHAARVDGAGWATLATVQNSPARLSANLADRKPYPLGVLLVHGVNPIHEWPGAPEKALANVGLIVATARVPDETAHAADLILPEASFLETWDIVPSPHMLALDYAALQQPAVAPLYESRAFEDMWFELARRIGGSVAAAVPLSTYAAWLPEAAEGLFRASRGTIAGSPSEERIATFMEVRGWKAGGPATPGAFWEAFQRSGSWADVPSAERSPTGVLGRGVDHFSFWPAAFYRDAGVLEGAPVGQEAIYEGTYGTANKSRSGNTADHSYPLRLLLFDTNTLWSGRTALTPVMLEMTGHREDIAWSSWVEIHPETARRGGITQGARVRLESPAGSLVTRARIVSVVPPDVVAMPRGLGHRHFGRFASGVGANPMELVAAGSDPRTGVMDSDTRVRLTPVPV
jgi:menaquinone reductase, molybdopterin-binding-like subunit